MIKIKVEELDNITIMHLDGNLFLETLNNVTVTWEEITAKTPRVIAIDCAGLKSLDSSSIGTLVKFFNEAMSKKIELVFYDLNPAIQKLFHTIHLQKFFSVMSGERFRSRYLGNLCGQVD